jgi:CRP/FNR family transcriptional regulator, cyclic AMP receptor protein
VAKPSNTLATSSRTGFIAHVFATSTLQDLSVLGFTLSNATPFTIADYGPRAAIFRQGDPCDSVMHIERGRVWLAVTAHSGKEAICGLLGTGAFLGEEALVGGGERRQSATAMTATQVLVVAKAHMIRLLRTQRGLLDRFIAHLLARNSRLETNLTDQLLYSSEQRLAHLLLVLANCDQRRPRRCALPHLSQEIIAEMVGTTRARVNAFMGKFKKLGFLEEHRGVLHVNPTRLDVVHDGDRRICIAASATSSQARESEERHWSLAG